MDLSRATVPGWITVVEDSQIGDARRQALALCRRHDVDEVTSGTLAIIAMELATNLVRHGGGGELLVRRVEDTGTWMEVLARDKGRGMTDVEQCLSDGYSTAGTPGTGLGAVRRLASHFDVFSAPDLGTVVMARVELAPPTLAAGRIDWAVLQSLAPGEVMCGDGFDARVERDRARFVVVDGLGHGPLAANAAAHALRACGTLVTASPSSLLEAMHRATSGTRGAAGAACSVDLATGAVSYAGVGNIAGCISATGTPNRGLMSHNGTLGAQMAKVQTFDYVLPMGAVLIMYSDGLRSRWTLDDYPGLRLRHPSIIAALLGRDLTRGNDDATVLVARRREAA